ncbi:FERM/acyl-CoA-binding protein, 3-helical bundle [Artemisia annua]|uniref:FERM/acyl-CoA-binding protein, 3-helical bundle n=1 Tax=Artemisia annua TaxID=35608 RepID=A0A2U1MBZ4_ARTAN|nr:FERM/acyl-CoA-binding protein, 3-helical bundle [Artemisia annua]
MEMLEQFFVTIIASFIFCMLITKISASTNHKKIKVVRKSKSLKKVSFAPEHEEFVFNKVVAEPTETKQVVIEAKEEDKSVSVHQKPSKMIEQENVAYDIKLIRDDDIIEDVKEEIGLISEEDDDAWEGVEKSNLQKSFGMASDYYGKNENSLRILESDVHKELYGLHKVATEGPCHEPQPMILKVSTRAKWDAWQKLGNMDPEVAMEKYITLLSEKVPEWSQG